jgi:Lipase (class 3)
MPITTIHSSTALEILSAVKKTLSAQNLSSVTVVGHSLGAALALLDGVFFSLQLPKDVTVEVISYGMPRVGNQAFADFVDSRLGGRVTHVNNREDPIPVVPPMSFGFHHPSGEIHILDSGAWDACPGTYSVFLPAFACGSLDGSAVSLSDGCSNCRLGQDNPSGSCIVGDLNDDYFEGNENDHDGPYDGITMGC